MITDKKYLIVNADDFGFSNGINQAVIQGSKKGIITSTTLMVNMPFAKDAGELAKNLDISVGIHSNITAGDTFCTENEGLFGKEGKVNKLRKSEGYLTEEDMTAITEEYKHQILEFENLIGRRPSHIDHHHNLQVIPGYVQMYTSFVRSQGLPARVMGNNLKEFEDIKHPDYLITNFFSDDELTLDNLINILENLKPGISEIITHPGVKTGEKLDSYTDIPRSKQLEILTDTAILEKIKESRINLVSYNIFK